jgi:hypothetical protein
VTRSEVGSDEQRPKKLRDRAGFDSWVEEIRSTLRVRREEGKHAVSQSPDSDGGRPPDASKGFRESIRRRLSAGTKPVDKA